LAKVIALISKPYLLSIPGIGESIKKGLATPIADCDGELDW
jgi:antitoxin YefM